MKITMSSEMAIHAVWYLAAHPMERPLQAPEIAHRLSVSSSYMVKILKQLAKVGILASKRGKTGGFRLGRDPARISLADVIGAVDGETLDYSCLHTTRCCPGPVSCAIHDTVQRAADAALAVLRSTTMADLASRGWRAPGPAVRPAEGDAP